MSTPHETPDTAGLAFFGRTCASVSHELKNNLALINENAGLLNDLMLRHQQGHPLSPEKMELISTRIARHVQKANETINNLNRFSHLPDTPLCSTDLCGAITLSCTLMQRAANQQQVEIVTQLPDGQLPLMTRPFELANLLALCIDAALPCVASGKLTISASRLEDGAMIRFGPIADAINVLPHDKEADALLDALDAHYEPLDGENAALCLNTSSMTG